MHTNVFYSEEDEGYIADIPDLEHCSAFGNTPDEALKEVLKMKETWLEVAREKGKRIPPPHYRPAIYQAVMWAHIAKNCRQSREIGKTKKLTGIPK